MKILLLVRSISLFFPLWVTNITETGAFFNGITYYRTLFSWLNIDLPGFVPFESLGCYVLILD